MPAKLDFEQSDERLAARHQEHRLPSEEEERWLQVQQQTLWDRQVHLLLERRTHMGMGHVSFGRVHAHHHKSGGRVTSRFHAMIGA